MMDALIKVGDKSTIIKNGGNGRVFSLPYTIRPGVFLRKKYPWTDFNENQFVCEAKPDGIIEIWLDAKIKQTQ